MRLTVLVLFLGLGGCAAVPPPALPPAPTSCGVGDPALSATLLFGRSRHGGGAITDAEWRDFLAEIVTPRFPDGLTTLDGNGQWRPRLGAPVSREPSSVVLIIAAPGAATLRKLQEIRDSYRGKFGQDSVGLVTAPVCASF